MFPATHYYHCCQIKEKEHIEQEELEFPPRGGMPSRISQVAVSVQAHIVKVVTDRKLHHMVHQQSNNEAQYQQNQ